MGAAGSKSSKSKSTKGSKVSLGNPANAPTIVILGSAGSVGSATIKALAALSKTAKIVAGTRDPASDKAKELLALGPNVSVVAADLGNPASLPAAVAGADAVFVNAPGAENRADLAINGINAAKDAAVKHIVVLSVTTADLRGTVFGRQFTAIEQAAKATGIPYTILRFAFFIDNNFAHAQSIKGQGQIYGPTNPNAIYNPVAVSDVAESTANVLLNPAAHAGKTYTVNSAKATTPADIAAAFTAAVGKTVTYVQVPYAAAKASFVGAGWPEWQVDGILELFNLYDADSSVTHNASQDFKTITGKEPLTVEQWVANVAGAFK